MGIDSLAFLAFFLVSLILYYTVSEAGRLYVLVGLSFLFVASYDLRGILFLAGTSLIIWYGALQIRKAGESGEKPAAIKQKKRRILIICNAVLVGTLVLLKYLAPAAISLLAPGGAMKILIPLGISYYTLQAVSYLVDVYWGRAEAEERYSRLLLYICYFPKAVQGPICRYGDFAREAFGKSHGLNMKNLKFGVQLMLWGVFKSYVVAGRIAAHVNYAFHGTDTAYGWAAFFGLMLFGIELYCNFSGGIDIIRGASQCFAIALPDNFSQPYFSRSLGDFWRRWHITMGTWIKDYVFYPFSMSKPMSRCKKKAKKHMPAKTANRLAMAAANIVAFLIVGIWHGSGGNFALWGLYNGIILAFSELMADVYKKGKALCRINEQSTGWYLFCVARTFLIVTIGWCTDCASSFMGSIGILQNMLHFSRTNLEILKYGSFSALLLLILPVGILLVVDILHEKKISIRQKIDSWPIACQMLFWVAMIQLIALLGGDKTGGGFIYANY